MAALGLALALPYLTKRGGVVFVTASLFANGEAGAWYEPRLKTSLFQDAAGTTPVSANGDVVGLMVDQSGNGVDASQSTTAAKPVYKVAPDRLWLDKIDDKLTLTSPGWVGTMVLATDSGTASYGVTIPAGAYGLGGSPFPGTAIIGALFRAGALTAGEKAGVEAYYVERGATASYGATTDFTAFWQGRAEITGFPLLDTSQGTSFYYAWLGCTSLTSFPLLDTSQGANFSRAWLGCTSLTSFPLLDTSQGTNFSFAWQSCASLTSFPLLDTAQGNSFYRAWYACTSLTSFPAHAFDNVKGGNFSGSFTSTALDETSIDGILVSLVASGIATGAFDQSGGSAPSVATGQPAIDTLRLRGWTVTTTGGY